MKTKAITFKAFLLVIIVFTVSCGEKVKDREALYPVREPNLATQSFITNVNEWAAERDVSKMNQKDFLAYIYSVNPTLDRDVIRELTYYNKINAGEKISLRYHYFDDEGLCQMEDVTGKFTKVKFRDEFVVQVFPASKANFFVALSCLNGMLAINGDPGISGDASMAFTIGKGQGLSRYLADDFWSINIAEEFGLPLYKGRTQSQTNKIRPSEARMIDVDKTQITVYVEEGWSFKLSGNNWTINGLTPAAFKRVHNLK